MVHDCGANKNTTLAFSETTLHKLSRCPERETVMLEGQRKRFLKRCGGTFYICFCSFVLFGELFWRHTSCRAQLERCSLHFTLDWEDGELLWFHSKCHINLTLAVRLSHFRGGGRPCRMFLQQLNSYCCIRLKAEVCETHRTYLSSHPSFGAYIQVQKGPVTHPGVLGFKAYLIESLVSNVTVESLTQSSIVWLVLF